VSDERKASRACCPKCSEPLICTFERPYKEFHCLGCGAWWEFLQPSRRPNSDALDERYAELLARFKAGERGPTIGVDP
jgi:hypothetical protein